jgi:hypothetical protein
MTYLQVKLFDLEPFTFHTIPLETTLYFAPPDDVVAVLVCYTLFFCKGREGTANIHIGKHRPF